MKLHDYIQAHMKTPFEWGRHDCVLFAAGWVREATGTDPLAGLASWDSARSAMRVIRAAGGLEHAINQRFERIDPRAARDGDLALYGKCVCVFSGSHIVGPNLAGLEFVRRSCASVAWRVRQ
jgi:hypothetical protein